MVTHSVQPSIFTSSSTSAWTSNYTPTAMSLLYRSINNPSLEHGESLRGWDECHNFLMGFSLEDTSMLNLILRVFYSYLLHAYLILLSLLCYSGFNRSHTYLNPLSYTYLNNPLSFITRWNFICEIQ